MNIEPDRLHDVFCFRDERRVGAQLAFSYERQRVILAENEITRGLPGKYVDTFTFPDGRFEIRWKGVSIPYSVFDKDQRVTHAAVTENNRLTVLLKNPNKKTKPVMGKIIKAIRKLPHAVRKSFTFDRGIEFVSWPHLQAEIGTQTWFCDPSSPWQKGTVENTNRRARRWLPRKRDIRTLSDHDMKEICDRLNNTPRKCLGWKTPAEVFREKILEEMA